MMEREDERRTEKERGSGGKGRDDNVRRAGTTVKHAWPGVGRQLGFPDMRTVRACVESCSRTQVAYPYILRQVVPWFHAQIRQARCLVAAVLQSALLSKPDHEHSGEASATARKWCP